MSKRKINDAFPEPKPKRLLDSKMLKCNYCVRTFNNEGIRKTHMDATHKDEPLLRGQNSRSEPKEVKPKRTRTRTKESNKWITGSAAYKKTDQAQKDYLLRVGMLDEQHHQSLQMQEAEEEDGGDYQDGFIMSENGSTKSTESSIIDQEELLCRRMDGEELVGGKVLSDCESEKEEEEDDLVMKLAEKQGAFKRWRMQYYKDFLFNKFVLPPEYDFKHTRELAMLSELITPDFADVFGDKSAINHDLLKLCEGGALSNQFQEHIHDFLLKYVKDEHLEQMLPPKARNLLAKESGDKGLPFTTYYPFKGDMFKNAQFEMGNMMDAVILMLKDLQLKGKVVRMSVITYVNIFENVCIYTCKRLHLYALTSVHIFDNIPKHTL